MQIPLFPLHAVLAPGIVLPLHVFEERYRLMVSRCLETSTPFGVVLIREGSEVAPRDGTTQELAIAGIGTFAEIRQANRFADGHWSVLAVGTGRFVIRDVQGDAEPYLLAEVDPYPDEPGRADPDDVESLATSVSRRFVEYLRLLQPREGETASPIDVQLEVGIDDDEPATDGEAWDDDDEAAAPTALTGADARELSLDDPEGVRVALRIPDDPSALSFLLTGIVQVEPDRRQALLEAAGAEERLRSIDALLDRELLLLDRRLAPFAVDRLGLASEVN